VRVETILRLMPSFRTTRRVPFTPRQMFDLVADVERYPEFLPLCEALVVKHRERQGAMDVLVADMTVGYKAVRETFTSRVTLDPAQYAVLAQGTSDSRGPFRRLENRWHFRAAPGGCEVDFSIAYEFKSMMLQMLVGALFDRAFRRYTSAFEERARAIYGAETSAARETS
jgi:coenzyme Q-binding protein COQ10